MADDIWLTSGRARATRAASEGDLGLGRGADVAVLIDGVGGDRVRVTLDEAVGSGAGAGAGGQTCTVVAYTVDQYGNASYPAEYRITP